MAYRHFIMAIISVVFAFVFKAKVYAQHPQQYIMEYIVDGNDTLAFELLPEAVILPQRKFASKKEYRQYYRMVWNLKRVYPYVKIAKQKLSEIDRRYITLPRKERKAYLKSFEKELFAEFEAPLKKLTRSQGKMLIKLIDRETGETSYEIIKELKGGFKAFMWQSVARLFGSNLKARYDKHGDDKILEELVLMCENGMFDAVYYNLYPPK